MLFTASIALALIPAAQAGGDSSIIYQFNSSSYWWKDLGYAACDAGDVNGDGFHDFLIGSPGPIENTTFFYAGHATLYSGATGLALAEFPGYTNFDRFGASLAGGSDLDGDGIPDFVIGAPAPVYNESGYGKVRIFSGATNALIRTYTSSLDGSEFGSSIALISDIDNDGVDDLVIGEPWANVRGNAYVYSGGTGALIYSYVATAGVQRLGGTCSGAGDVDGDGTPDFMIGSPSLATGYYIEVFSGATGNVIHQIIGGYSSDELGDLDNDGYPDVVVGYSEYGAGPGTAKVLSGRTWQPIYSWSGDYSHYSFGEKVANAGDLDGDGVTDILVSAPWATVGGVPYKGYVVLYSGATGEKIWRYEGPGTTNIGRAIVGVGDVNGQGGDDLILGMKSKAFVMAIHPFLHADTRTVSAAAGGVVNLDLNFPVDAGFMDYKVLISFTGIGPSTYGVDIPLTQDSLVVDTFRGNYPVPNYANLHGSLDSVGDASASLTVPAGISSSLIGRTYWMAAIANPTGQLPAYSSMAVTLEIVP